MGAKTCRGFLGTPLEILTWIDFSFPATCKTTQVDVCLCCRHWKGWGCYGGYPQTWEVPVVLALDSRAPFPLTVGRLMEGSMPVAFDSQVAIRHQLPDRIHGTQARITLYYGCGSDFPYDHINPKVANHEICSLWFIDEGWCYYILFNSVFLFKLSSEEIRFLVFAHILKFYLT